MKKRNITLWILFALLWVGCGESFLDKNDPTRLSSGNFYQTEEQCKQAATGVYSQLQDYTKNAWQLSEFITDNTTVHFNQTDRGQVPGLEAIEYWQINATTLEQIGPYNLYKGIYQNLVNVNTLLARLKNATFSEQAKTSYEGQMKFMRAYYYFQLVQLFGDVIIVTEPITNPDQAWEFERSPVAKVYELIDNDLKFAVEALPNPADQNKADIGRPTRGAALTLQGRTLLARKQYAAAIESFKQVLPLGYQLLPDYAVVFDPVHKNHKESIFDVQFQGGNDLGEHNDFLYNFYPRESYGAVIPFPGVSGGGWNIPTLDIIGAYETGDKRKAVSLKEGYYNKDSVWMPIPYINKYNHPHTIERRPDNNWPLMRYAEVLLSLAEAINEKDGPTEEAYNHLNQVRERAGLAPLSGLSKETFREKILHERRMELAFENHRWFDLKRTLAPSELVAFLNAYGKKEMAEPTTPTRAGTAFSEGDFEIQEYELLFPIPEQELRLNKKLKQNPGY